MFCFLQHKEGFENLTGVDYSEKAIQLAKSVAEEEDINIVYEVMFLNYVLLHTEGTIHMTRDVQILVSSYCICYNIHKKELCFKLLCLGDESDAIL